MKDIGKKIARQFGLKKAPRVHFIEHHLAHAASAFFVSPFQEAAVLTLDGRGESTSTMMSRGRGNHIEKLVEIAVPQLLGHLYAAVTDYLGFKPFFDEWKVMGMSAYGKDTYVSQFSRIVKLLPEGRLQLGSGLFFFSYPGQQLLGQRSFL